MSHLWSGRFDAEPDPGVFEFGRSFAFDRQLFQEDVTGSLAWVEALALAGAIRPDEAHTIAVGLRDILSLGTDDPAWVDGPDEDVHAFVERVLVERIGPVGKRLHTGRSRNEQVSVDLRLYVMRKIPLLQRGLARLVGALASQADAAGDAVMPAYTHVRRAQPILTAHYFLGHSAAFRRDYDHFDFAIRSADCLPLGSGAVAGTSYAIDTEALARRLGFSRVAANSIDASSDRDFVAVFLHACALAMVHVSRLAEDLVLFTSEEFGFFELSDAVATGSSLMPQKKNPDPLELVRGKAGRAIGHLAGWLSTMKGLPSGYNKDLQEDKEALFDAEATLARSLAAITAVVATLGLKRQPMRAAASGLLVATDVADYLVARGVAFREAHETVGAIVRSLVAEGRSFESLTLTEWKRFSPLFDTAILKVITPQSAVAARLTPQSTNPAAVAAALRDLGQWLEAVSSAPAAAGSAPGS